MTFEQSKDQVAKAYGWDSYEEFDFNETCVSTIKTVIKEAAEIYAKSEYERGYQDATDWLK